MRTFALATIACFTIGALPGCVTPETPASSDTPAPPMAPKDHLLGVLDAIPNVTYDRMQGVNWWENFVTTYDYRLWGTPKNLAAAAYLASELKAAGFETETVTYKQQQAGTPATRDFLAVKGVHKGTTNPEHRLILISHYDTVPQTAQGAYDDGAGTAVQMEICKLLVKVQMNKTVECAFYDGEEQGLVASRMHAAQYAAAVKDGKAQYFYDQGFGYDMTGLNWPGFSTWDLYVYLGMRHANLGPHTSGTMEFLNVTVNDFFEKRFPGASNGMTTAPINPRNSDESSFMAVGVPVIRFAGGRVAGDYPMYHQPLDTTAFVYTYACTCQDLARGKDIFSKGFEMVVLTSYYTILAFDRYDPMDLPF